VTDRYDPLWREKDVRVIRLIADGLTNKEIAKILGVKPGTVKGYVHDLCLDVSTVGRMNLVGIARELGYLGEEIDPYDDKALVKVIRERELAAEDADAELGKLITSIMAFRDRMEWYVLQKGVHPSVVRDTTMLIKRVERVREALNRRENESETDAGN